ncbi:thiamine pyrophosphate-dependent enzyme [Dictyobacter kobayashii]|uniref:Transketolase n=1 Tax=Dictyobacter kobayashii TaxID=2014872 RepID=A0A402AXC9_9CHLR|nr:thiamine pyrophosphate-dependent enzyme [Dictyobacter kobayashii]GCE23729.1 transketolase [Dictyobacter kobayashii]
MTTDLTAIKKLMTLATGDEKHNASAHSTLDILWVLYDRVMRYDPQQPRSEERDRFILSKGHGPVALYAILAARGFFPTSELARFKSWEGILGAHPDRHQVPGIEVSTGSLGHGLPMAIGVSLALQAKNSDRRVFALVGDGECNEGSIWEAVLLAAQKQLGQLTCIVINNRSSSLDLGDLEDKFATFGWDATTINGRDHEQIYAALTQPATSRPTAIIAEIAERKGA